MSPPPQITVPGASPEEAAAVVAAVQRFRSDLAVVPAAPTEPPAGSAWGRAALREGVTRAPEPPPPWT